MLTDFRVHGIEWPSAIILPPDSGFSYVFCGQARPILGIFKEEFHIFVNYISWRIFFALDGVLASKGSVVLDASMPSEVLQRHFPPLLKQNEASPRQKRSQGV